MSLIQYRESQEDQDITRLLNFTRTQEKRKYEGFYVPWNEWGGDLYSSGEGNMNGMSFNEGLPKNNKPRHHFSLRKNLVH